MSAVDETCYSSPDCRPGFSYGRHSESWYDGGVCAWCGVLPIAVDEAWIDEGGES